MGIWIILISPSFYLTDSMWPGDAISRDKLWSSLVGEMFYRLFSANLSPKPKPAIELDPGINFGDIGGIKMSFPKRWLFFSLLRPDIFTILMNILRINIYTVKHFWNAVHIIIKIPFSHWLRKICLWYRGLSLWQPAVPPIDVGSSYWQLLPVLVFIPCEYTCWVFDENTCINILSHWPCDQLVDIF